MIKHKNWMLLREGVKACKVGYEFTDIEKFSLHRWNLKDAVIQRGRVWDVSANYMICYVDNDGVVKHIYTTKEAKRMLKIGRL